MQTPENHNMPGESLFSGCLVAYSTEPDAVIKMAEKTILE
jgi:hypothetical protein